MRRGDSFERSLSLMCYDAAIRQEMGVQLLAGVDEVGRGALAGPLVAAAVILPDRLLIHGLDDSKRLSPEDRIVAALRVTRAAVCWGIVFASPRQIDRNGLQATNIAAMCSAVAGLSVKPDMILSDCYPLRGHIGINRAIVRGDQLSQSIAAASCLAKVVRDAWMSVLGREFCPGYGWERNAGYATPEHRRVVQAMGPTALHRRLFLRKLDDRHPGEKRQQVSLPFAE